MLPGRTSKCFLLLLSFLFLMLSIVSNAQTKNQIHSIFLTSNIIDIENQERFIERINEILLKQTKDFTFIINGDITDSGFDKHFEEDSTRIVKLLIALSKFDKGNIIIIPGDRDWDNSGKNGLDNINKLESLIKSLKIKNVRWSIPNGCPGQDDIELNDNLLLITIDTQWWNHPFEIPGPIDGDCKVCTTDDFKEEVEDIINENPDKNIIIAGHFPIISGGEYGGHRPFYKHIFPLLEWNEGMFIPLPFLGSFYQSYRENIGSTEDIVNERFELVRELIGNIISDFNSLVYISGHEKNHQVIERNNNYFINSGAPETGKYSSEIDGTILSENEPGIMELIYQQDGRVVSTFHQFNNNEITSNQFNLFESQKSFAEEDELINDSAAKYSGTTKVAAGPEYEAGSLKKLFFGEHYRDSWTTEVEIPYLNLDTTKRGLLILKKGGGRQTLSLVFEGNDGIRYSFRSVNKDPIKALDYDLRKTVLAEIVKDQTTTQHPYGAMAVDILLNELEIIHAHPELYVMPDSPELGRYKEDFGNLPGMLEENPSNPEDGKKGFAGADEIIRSNKLFRKLYNDHDNHVDSKSFAVARAFDILVGDWGKHEDNWKWFGFKKNDKTIFKPMPRDRDHVFSRWDGIFPWLADREWAKESGEDFDYEISGLRSLMFQARHLDRFITSDLSKQDWLDAAHYVQSRINDKIIEKAIKNMPEEIYKISGKEIEDKLKERIKDLDKYVLEYYEMISPEVDVVGSNKKEFFEVLRKTDGSVDVSVYNVKDNSKGDELLYSRTFFNDETDDIRLYGLGNDDIFNINGETDKSIQIRIIGGSGKDSISDLSNTPASTLVYDKGKKTYVNKGENTDIVEPYNESLYNYNRTAFAYDTYFPLPYIFYSSDDGVSINLGVEFITHNFEKKDYSSIHNINLSASTNETYGAKYSLRLHHVFRGWDVLLNGHYDNPLPNIYFYGLGNETTKDDNLYNDNYYRTRYSSKGISAGVIYDYWKKSSVYVNISYENNERQSGGDSSILAIENFTGKDKINFFEGTIGIDLDFRDHSILPTSGMRLFTEYNAGYLTNHKTRYDILFGMAEGYISFPIFIPFSIGIKVGGGLSYGQIPFYNLFNLGQNTYLKGFRNNRFTGTSMLFYQTGLKLPLFEFGGIFVPMKVGAIGFYNSGKIFQRGEISDIWHNGHGFGLYVIPLREDFTIHTIFSFSKEETLLFEFGIGAML